MTEKLQYPKTHKAYAIAERCKGISFVFTYLKDTDQHVGTLVAVDDLCLRLHTDTGEVIALTAWIDIYPELGLITYINRLKVTES